MGLSLWQRGGASADAGASTKRECEVCVIGAGISGVCAALELQRRGVDTVLVEAGRVAGGASGRNAGFLMRGAASCYAVMAREHGRDVAKDVWSWTEANLRRLRALGAADMEGYVERASCLVAIDEGEDADLRESASMLEEDGFRVELIEPDGAPDDAIWRSGSARVGLVNPDDAACDPVRLVGALRARLGRIRLIEQAEVWCIEDASRGVLVRTNAGQIAAQHVVVCANAWVGGLLPRYAGVVTPNRGQMLGVRYPDPGRELLRFSYYINRGHDYVRPGPGGLVLMGGARDAFTKSERGFGVEPTEPVQAELEARLARYVGDGFEVVHRWAGTMGFSPDGLPLVGPASEDGAVWVCAGFTGHGMSMAALAAERVVGAMLDAGSVPAWMDPGRFVPAGAGEERGA